MNKLIAIVIFLVGAQSQAFAADSMNICEMVRDYRDTVRTVVAKYDQISLDTVPVALHIAEKNCAQDKDLLKSLRDLLPAKYGYVKARN